MCFRRNLFIFQAPSSIKGWFAEWSIRGATAITVMDQARRRLTLGSGSSQRSQHQRFFHLFLQGPTDNSPRAPVHQHRQIGKACGLKPDESDVPQPNRIEVRRNLCLREQMRTEAEAMAALGGPRSKRFGLQGFQSSLFHQPSDASWAAGAATRS